MISSCRSVALELGICAHSWGFMLLHLEILILKKNLNIFLHITFFGHSLHVNRKLASSEWEITIFMNTFFLKSKGGGSNPSRSPINVVFEMYWFKMLINPFNTKLCEFNIVVRDNTKSIEKHYMYWCTYVDQMYVPFYYCTPKHFYMWRCCGLLCFLFFLNIYF